MNPTLEASLTDAVSAGNLLSAAKENIVALLAGSRNPVYPAAITELVEAGQWEELNDRFFRTLAFGTGGLRGRSIGRVVTEAEKGQPDAIGRPQFPCVGTNAMNYFNISRATQGLVRYVQNWLRQQGSTARGRIAISHDTRHFSREFAELTAKVASEMGCDVFLVESFRSTPELSFAVRYTRSHAGVMVTASHNPAHDNGYKVYFHDGAQVLPPHDQGIIAEVDKTRSEQFDPVPVEQRGKINLIGEQLDAQYLARLRTVVMRPELLRETDVKIVYTPIHGTGAISIMPLLESVGLSPLPVPSQMEADGRFPTVPSPNPENPSALELGMKVADECGADLLLATDPDADRLGAAIRDPAGGMAIITGNQIGAMLAYYRALTLFEKGILHDSNRSRGVILKTFVTTDLLKAIADHFGLRCVETLTGFKYIGRKLSQYEAALPAEFRENYRELTEEASRDARLAHSSYYVCGGEESYGYLAADFVRDKDANMAALLFAEMAAYVRSRGQTLRQFLDEIYARFGFYWERNEALIFEGASGATRIVNLVASYASNPPAEIDGVKVEEVKDFAAHDYRDSEGERIPKEKMTIFHLADGSRVAVRASGTEPKIKYYLFGMQKPPKDRGFTAEELAGAEATVKARLEKLWQAVEADANART